MTKKLLIGLVPLLAVAAFAMAPSAALAGEYGRCVEVGPGNGSYEDAGCTEAAAGGEYEWVPVPAGSNIPYTSSTGTAVLKSAAGEITCTASTDVGKITGATTDEDTVTFTGCTTKVGTETLTCQNTGESLGTIKTNLLATSLIDFPNGPAEGDVWTRFESPSGPSGYQAEYECGGFGSGLGELFRVSGSLAGTDTPVDVMATTSTTKFTEAGGEQGLKLEIKPPESPSWSPAIASEELTKGTTTFEEEIEIRAS